LLSLVVIRRYTETGANINTQTQQQLKSESGSI